MWIALGDLKTFDEEEMKKKNQFSSRDSVCRHIERSIEENENWILRPFNLSQ